MALSLTIPDDLEALVRKRLASGAFASAEDVLRRALEAQDAEESWTEEEQHLLDQKIRHALNQAENGKVLGPDEARRKLAALRARHLERLG